MDTQKQSPVKRPAPEKSQAADKPRPVKEIGGRTKGPEPTRYGDWEKDGKCVDF